MKHSTKQNRGKSKARTIQFNQTRKDKNAQSLFGGRK